MLVCSGVSWRNAKKTVTTSSIMATKFIACYETSNHGIWLRNLVTMLQIVEGIERSIKIYYDNKSVVLYSNDNRSSAKSKHIDIKFLVVKEMVQSGNISIKHLGTISIITYPLTKGLPSKIFHEHTACMGVLPLVKSLV